MIISETEIGRVFTNYSLYLQKLLIYTEVLNSENTIMPMKKNVITVIKITAIMLLTTIAACQSYKQIPLVYDVENTGSKYALPVMPEVSELPVIHELDRKSVV